jgi:ABC-type multidrug transport system ATPase subunit/uncharacterized membrane protein SpoIIM required for sporulation/ABC-type transport system involved in multi-copper enzyme maturation permease subunit
MIELAGLTKRFARASFDGRALPSDDVVAVDRVTLTIHTGEVMALLGPNGAGKTTTVRMLAALLRPTAGWARVAGQDVATQGPLVRRQVGVLTEAPGLYSRMTGWEYLDFYGRLRGLPSDLRTTRIAALSERFDIATALPRRLAEYSKGMRQKVALVRTLLHDPPILLLDEPTSAMDPESARLVRDAILQLRGRPDRTILVCTHNLAEAEELCDRMAIIRQGRLVALGTPAELKARLLGPPLMELRLALPLPAPADRRIPPLGGEGAETLLGVSGRADAVSYTGQEGKAREVVERFAEVETSADGRIRFRSPDPAASNPALIEALARGQIPVLTLSEVPQSLESVYLRVVADGGDDDALLAGLEVAPDDPAPVAAGDLDGPAAAAHPPLDEGVIARLRRGWERTVPTLTITRREVRDTLRDWRIVVPIVILVVCFPVLANFVAAQGIGFVGRYGGDLIIERLFPFLMLVVGFFPGTFSLVIALETFVGEKERHSLEPLLMTPLTDLQLYVGKLLAATFPSVAASYLGMAAYALLLGLRIGWWPSPSLLLLAAALSTLKSVVMVAAAVIISSQSTSVRGANLVASFIIVPMALLLQVEAGMLLYAQYNALWMVALALLVVTALLVRLGIRIFNRELLLGRDLDQLDLAGGLRTFRRAVWPRRGVVGIYRDELPGLLRGIRAELAITVLVVLVGGLAVGLWGSQRFPLPLEAFSLDQIVDTAAIESLVAETGLLSTFTTRAVLLNNVRSLLVSAMLALLSLGTMALLLLMVPVVIVAYIGLQVGQLGLSPWLFIAVTVLPHGIFELPGAILATAQAMRVGDVILAPPSEGGGIMGIIRELGHFVKLFVWVVLPALLIGAWIEVNLTPRLLIWFLTRQP